MAEQTKILFRVDTPGGPRNIVLDGGFDPCTAEGSESWTKFCDPPHISRMAEARDLEFCILIEGWGPKTVQK